jgi:hypothetical protein
VYCQACGKQIPDDSAFCNKCGTRQGATTAPQPQVVEPTSFFCRRGFYSTAEGREGGPPQVLAEQAPCNLVVFTNAVEIQVPATGDVVGEARLADLTEIHKHSTSNGIFRNKYQLILRFRGIDGYIFIQVELASAGEQENVYQFLRGRTR